QHSRALGRAPLRPAEGRLMTTAPTPEPISLAASGRLKRRRLLNRVMEAIGTLAALIAVAILAVVVIGIFRHAIDGISLTSSTDSPVPFGQSGGGLRYAIIGSAEIVLLATLMAVPFGILVA